ncbi:MAG: hypothetical protein KatS3mg084_0245 [Candidatus Dojkabacteria bacterium]|nr:MAG: hypothetical protein KatS3mg084_0245 [Candidatus Dojkabacteria bacterium]
MIARIRFLSLYLSLVIVLLVKLIRKRFRFYFLTLLAFTTGSILFIKFKTNYSWLFSYEFFHESVLIPMFWYYVPVLLIIGTLNIVFSEDKLPTILNLSRYPRFVLDINILILIVTLIGALGQIAGGCIWQIPLILLNEYGYAWARYGVDTFPEPIPFIFYIIIFFVLLFITEVFIKKAYPGQL